MAPQSASSIVTNMDEFEMYASDRFGTIGWKWNETARMDDIEECTLIVGGKSLYKVLGSDTEDWVIQALTQDSSEPFELLERFLTIEDAKKYLELNSWYVNGKTLGFYA
jgi:hypothetical protein